ncbi:hypothetical protein GIB67_011963 [Kingdonia uniflora]|uniref:Uncharacterized protein n=1 Tax=Kingdonia uniflora TaxID=39325 RepID=A0A7J7M081_9MAGN|nr:hypothetical protein GIB67_011963 [Kingdonia uniflora]
MDSTQNQLDNESYVYMTQLYMMQILPMVLRTVVELDLLEIIAREGKGAQLSASVITSHLPSNNPNAPNMIDRILRLLSCYSLLHCSIDMGSDGKFERLYSLAPASKFLVRNEDGVSLAPFIIYGTSKPNNLSWYVAKSLDIAVSHFKKKANTTLYGYRYYLKDAILEGGIPFVKANRAHLFDNPTVDPDLIECQMFFDKAMFNSTNIVMKKILEVYKGFEGLKQIVDVGGGHGNSINIITSKYSTIEGINYDLPHVINTAPSHPGVKHIGGDMFASVPKGDAIFLKWIIHDWSDEHCAKILKNCYEALPDQGKVIIIEGLLTDVPNKNIGTQNLHLMDAIMMMGFNGGKERTEQELEALVKGAGFSHIEKICCVYETWVIECYKN